MLRPSPFSLAMLAAALITLLVGCSATTVSLPAVTDNPTGERSSGRIIWRDLITDTPAASRRFYETLFGWEFQAVGNLFGLGSGSAYSLIRHNGRLIGGMVDANAIGRGEGEDVAQWVVLMSVDDVDAAVTTARANGAEILTPPTDLASRGRMAVITDPQGALLALLETRDGDPPQADPGYGDFLWDELWTSDVEGAAAFYDDLVGFTDSRPPVAAATDTAFRVLSRDGEPRAGMLPHPFEGERPVWVTYLRVADPAAITAQVAALGGKVYVEAQARPLGGTVALIADPSGAGIALQTWPLTDNAAPMETAQ